MRPRPQSATPAVLLYMVKSFVPLSLKETMRFSGIPHIPKPEDQYQNNFFYDCHFTTANKKKEKVGDRINVPTNSNSN